MLVTEGGKFHIESNQEISEDLKPTPVEQHQFVRRLGFMNRGGADIPIFLVRQKPYNIFQRICFRLVGVRVDNFPKELPL